MISWKAVSSGTELSVSDLTGAFSWAQTPRTARAATATMRRRACLVMFGTSGDDKPGAVPGDSFLSHHASKIKRDSPWASDLEGARIDPLLLKDRPEILGQAAEDILIRQPSVALLAPPLPPRVADEER